MALCDDPARPFVPGEFRVRLATTDWERAGSFRLRREVFCTEQGIFADDDRDAIDDHATPIVALSCLLGEADGVVGTVRIHSEDGVLWFGSRLAVHRDIRRLGNLGAALIRMAVCTAHTRGARRFLAHVQAQNVPLFEKLHWASLSQEMLHGRPHHLMQADLAWYPPHQMAEQRVLRRAA
jgi:putative N-acetyltransferase (TIGR04045 family)